MRYGTYLPALAGCFALVLLAGTASRSVGQGRITDESTPVVVEPTAPATTPPTKITVKPGEAAVTAPAAKPGTPAPAKPAAPAEVVPDIKLLVAEVGKLETQADQAIANQQKIDASLAELAKTIETARIYASRSGKGTVAP